MLDRFLAISQETGAAGISGFFEGDVITSGRFAGGDWSNLPVRYPYRDGIKAAGHALSIVKNGTGILAELRDRHLEPTVNDCNFDLARMSLKPVVANEGAVARFRRMEEYFEAQLARAEAIALAREGRYEAALPYYERALCLAESAKANTPGLLSPYIVSLANVYLKLGGIEEFDRLYDRRSSALPDDAVKALFTGYRVASLIRKGKIALKREEYAEALELFQRACLMQPHHNEAIAGVMTVCLRTGKQDEAILFLENSMKRMDNEAARRELRVAIAQVYYLKALKHKGSGNGVEAEADLKKAIALDSGAVLYHVALARLRHKLGSLAEAESLLDRAGEQFTDEASRREIVSVRERIRQTDKILTKLKRVEG